MLDRDPASVEDFIEHLAILTRINNDLPNLENEFHVVTRLFAIAQEFNLLIDPEQYAFFKSLGSIFHHLKVDIFFVDKSILFNLLISFSFKSQVCFTPKRNAKKI